MTPRPMRRPGKWIEVLLATVLCGTLVWTALQFFWYGYLPQPFFYEPSDTWMDWFNTAYWSHNAGAYDSWGTIYPPLSFAILRFLTNSACYIGESGLETRNCDLYGVLTLHAIYLLNLFLIWKTFSKIDRRTAVPRTIALGAGMPMLFALERGNILLLAFTFMLLAFGPLIRSARLRWLFAGLAVNLKVYLIGAVFAQLLKRRWRWFEGALIATVVVYFLSYVIVGAGTPMEIYSNISNYSTGFQAASPLDLWYSGTYMPLLSLLTGETFPVVGVAGSRPVDLANLLVPLLTHVTQATIVLAAAHAWVRPEVVPPYRLTFLATALALISSEAGGYTQILLILFVFMEPWRGAGRKFAILISYVLCMVADIPIEHLPPVVRDSYLGGRTVIAEYSLSIGPFLRPGLVLFMALALSMTTIREVWARLRKERSDARSDPGGTPALEGKGL